MKHQFRNSVKDVQIQPRADNDSDHNLVVAKICTRLKISLDLEEQKKLGMQLEC